MRYYDDKKPPRWRFGSGMGYARFEHELLSAPEGELAAGGAICLRLALRNASGRDGAAVPQLYIHRTQGVATSRARQLVDWKKLRLRAGEGAETELSIPPEALRQEQEALEGQVQRLAQRKQEQKAHRRNVRLGKGHKKK